jgi:hypothetical protein
MLKSFKVVDKRYNLECGEDIIRNLDQCQVDNFLAYKSNPTDQEYRNCLRVGFTQQTLAIDWTVVTA